MEYDRFVELVAQRADVAHERARALTYASLGTLGTRISSGEARDLAGQLPAELQPGLSGTNEPAEEFNAGDFVRRVAEGAGVAEDAARAGARAVLVTLREAVSEGEWKQVTAQLSEDYGELIGPAT